MSPAEALQQRGMVAWLAPYAGYLLEWMFAQGWPFTITSVYRSRARQEALYQRYLAGLSKYPAAAPGRSYHERGRAMDVSAAVEHLAAAGARWQYMGGTWAGQVDPIHFQA